MASTLLKQTLLLQPLRLTQNPSSYVHPFSTAPSSSSTPGISTLCNHYPSRRLLHLGSVICSSVSVPDQQQQLAYSPPTTKEEAILQAKTCLSNSLAKPLNNPRLAAGKLKKQKQPRLRVEIPVFDDSPDSLVQLAVNVFSNLGAGRKGNNKSYTTPKVLVFWPSPELASLADSSSNSVANSDLSMVDRDWNGLRTTLSSVDVAVFFSPDGSQLKPMKSLSELFHPKPLVMFNPKWSYDEEAEFGELTSFVRSFDVVYSFMGLEVRGVLSKRKGVVFRCIGDGGPGTGEGWGVLMEEENGELKLVTRFKRRPAIGEVENVLYNIMALNSPVTKAVKFFRSLTSTVKGKK